MKFSGYFEKIVKEFSSTKYRDEIENAKVDFFKMSGMVHEDEEVYEERINSFLDWYVFDRDLNDEDLTPVEMFLKNNFEALTEEEKKMFEGFIKSIHSLFLVKKTREKNIYIKDMFTERRYMITDLSVSGVVNKGDIFEARLVPFHGVYIFSKGFCFHPAETRGYIVSEIKKIRNMDKRQHILLMMKLAVMKLKIIEYPHVDVSNIYSRKPKIKF